MTLIRQEPARTRILVAVALLAAGAVAGCGGAPTSESTRPPTTTAVSAASLRVFVAEPLRGVFKDITRLFESGYPGTSVQVVFGKSAELVERMKSDAPDVVALAASDMETAARDGRVTSPAAFASNRLAIVVPTGNPGHVTAFEDLGRPGLRVAVCAPDLSCGAAAATVESATGVHLTPSSTETTGSAVVDKVADGGADAGLVYSTYAKSQSDRVEIVDFSKAQLAVEDYSIAVTSGTKNAERSGQLVDLVKGDMVHRTMADAGFGAP